VNAVQPLTSSPEVIIVLEEQVHHGSPRLPLDFTSDWLAWKALNRPHYEMQPCVFVTD